MTDHDAASGADEYRQRDTNCANCGHLALVHLVDDEERRECRACHCAQYVIPHETDGAPCWCEPVIENHGFSNVIIHRSKETGH